MKNILTGPVAAYYYAEGDEVDPDQVGGKESVHISEEAKKFAERFKPPVGTPGITDPSKLAPLVNEKDQPPAGETPEQKSAREERAQTKKKPGSNVPEILEAKRKAEAALKEKEEKVTDYEKNVVPKLNATIAELQAKVDGGRLSEAKEKEMQSRIDALTAARDEKERKLDEELTATKKRLAQLSITDDPVYKEKYVKPLGESIEAMRNIVGENKIVGAALNRAMMAQRSALEADSEEAMRGAEAERDAILDSILDGLGTTAQKRMSAAFDKFIDASTAQAVAQADHEKTSLELRKESERELEEGVANIIREWEAEYKRQGAEYNVALTDEEAKEAESLGVAVDLAKEEEFAIGAIQGKHGQKDVVKLVQRGRTAPIWKAKAIVYEARLKEAMDTIKNLRGAAPVGGSRSHGAGGGVKPEAPPASTNSNGKSREEWQRERFKPPGA